MFFTQINQLMAQSVDITMVIRKSATGMTVSDIGIPGSVIRPLSLQD